ncbi:MAG: hypothetical protein WBO95_06525 [Candidatus Dechloromonas phosphoritropha]
MLPKILNGKSGFSAAMALVPEAWLDMQAAPYLWLAESHHNLTVSTVQLNYAKCPNL